MKEPAATDSSLNPMFRRAAFLLHRALEYHEKTRHRLTKLGTCSVAFKQRGVESAPIVDVDNGELSLLAGGSDGKVEIQGDLASAQQVQTLIAEASLDCKSLVPDKPGTFPRGKSIAFCASL